WILANTWDSQGGLLLCPALECSGVSRARSRSRSGASPGASRCRRDTGSGVRSKNIIAKVMPAHYSTSKAICSSKLMIPMAGERIRIEDFAERAICAGSDHDAWASLRDGDDQDSRYCDGERPARKISGADSPRDEKRAHRGKRTRSQRRIPAAATAIRDLFKRG